MQAKRAARDAGRPLRGSPSGSGKRPNEQMELPGEHTALHGFELARVPQRCGPLNPNGLCEHTTLLASACRVHSGADPGPERSLPDPAAAAAGVHSGADPWTRTVSASTRPSMACSLPASHSVAPTPAASRVPLPSTLVTDRSLRPATLSATALRISAAAARADTATVQNVNRAGRAENPIVPAFVLMIPPFTRVPISDPEARESTDPRNPRNPYRSRP
jgi:hypothetical protein